MKTCRKCGEEKPLERYSTQHGVPHAQTICKECDAARTREWTQRNHKRKLESDRRYYAANAERYSELNRRSRAKIRTPERQRLRQNNDPRIRARRQLIEAVRLGRIIKPDACQDCKRPIPKRSLHGHHHLGYLFPLEVTWLCSTCHGRLHRVAA